MGRKTPRRKTLTHEDHVEIVRLHRENNWNGKEIGKHLNLDGRAVAAVIVNARKSGQLGVHAPPAPEETFPPPPPGPAPAPAPGPSPAAGADDGFAWRGSGTTSAGFSTGGVRYQVERIAPPDGILGTEKGAFDIEQLGRLYGSGTYKITKHDPAVRGSQETTVTLGEPYGPPRWPERTKREPETAASPAARLLQRERPVREPYYARMAEFGRQGFMHREQERPPQNDGVAAEALRQMGQMTRTIMERPTEKSPEPQRQVPEEANRLEKILKDDRERSERTLKTERDREEGRRREDEKRYERDRQERADEHKREMDRMRQETDGRMKLEEERRKSDKAAEETRRESEKQFFKQQLDLIKQEAKIKADALEAELKANREKMDSVLEGVSAELAEAEKKADARYKEKETFLNRELDAKDKHMGREHDLRKEILTVEQKIAEAKGSGSELEAVGQILNSGLQQIAATANRYMDLKEMELVAGAPPAPGAAGAPAPAAPTMRGKVRGPHAQGAQAPAAAPGAPAQAPASPVTQDTQPNGADASPNGGEVMQDMVEKMVKEPFFKSVLSEWTTHIKAGTHPIEFADYFLELLQHHDQKVRLQCKGFNTFMSAREWPQFYEALRPNLEPNIIEIFDTESAKVFYDEFKELVRRSLQAYYYPQQQAAPAQPAAAPEETPAQ